MFHIMSHHWIAIMDESTRLVLRRWENYGKLIGLWDGREVFFGPFGFPEWTWTGPQT